MNNILYLQVNRICSKKGSFEILKKIGSGGFGKVYKAREEKSNRIVAVKLLREKCDMDDKIREVSHRQYNIKIYG